jgi:chorismate mutase
MRLRKEIDDLHRDLAKWIKTRFHIADKIWQKKASLRLPLLAPARETSLIHSAGEKISDPDLRKAFLRIQKCILAENKRYLKKKLKFRKQLVRAAK